MMHLKVNFVFKDKIRASQRTQFVSTQRPPSWCCTHQ